ncbi:unnamed protein product [Nyctereutes procyonoides]|uniref:L-methionine (R)-S-oxide reductase n=1 Tax=Nyctereutes procyonoides TaxID=34880 RepID=A0A811Y5B9_NYCPR|nr:unnamed protein product [Nyctereutes procyonoides]
MHFCVFLCCVCYDNYSSVSKYCSGTGWPSFSETHRMSGSDKSSTGMLRYWSPSSISCWLGPAGQRFCIPSVALKFQSRRHWPRPRVPFPCHSVSILCVCKSYE